LIGHVLGEVDMYAAENRGLTAAIDNRNREYAAIEAHDRAEYELDQRT